MTKAKTEEAAAFDEGSVVVARKHACVNVDGAEIYVRRGGRYPASHPVVLQVPELFVNDGDDVVCLD